jgi:excisionase family DNA binding protein
MTTATNTTQPPADLPPLPMTVPEAARFHKVSITTVKRWVAQNRIPSQRRGGGAHRAAATLILSHDRPDRAAPGTLSEEQRKAWNKGKKKAKPTQQ